VGGNSDTIELPTEVRRSPAKHEQAHRQQAKERDSGEPDKSGAPSKRADEVLNEGNDNHDPDANASRSGTKREPESRRDPAVDHGDAGSPSGDADPETDENAVG